MNPNFLFLLLSDPINHLTTRQIYLMTLCGGPRTPSLVRFNHLPVYKVFKTSSTFSSDNVMYHINHKGTKYFFHPCLSSI